MNFIKNNYKKLLIFTIYYLLLTFILSIGYYYDLLTIKTIKILLISILLITFLIIGFKTGQKSIKKGYISGLICSLKYISIIFIISLIIGFKMINILYYLLLIIITMIGGMIGINKK